MLRRISKLLTSLGIALSMFILFGVVSKATFASDIASLQTANLIVAETRSEPDTWSGTRVISATESRLIIEFRIPTFTVLEDMSTSQTCQRITIDNFDGDSFTGQIGLPALGVLIGIPDNARYTLKVLETDTVELLQHYNLCPVAMPRLEYNTEILSNGMPLWLPDPKSQSDIPAYALDSWMPEEAVELQTIGYIRDQAVAQLQFHPFQYHQVSGQLRHLPRIRLEITFHRAEGDITEGAAHHSTDSFDPLLKRLLLNYDQTTFWRLDAKSSPSVELMQDYTPANADQPAYRITIEKSGLYRLTYSQLQAADPSVNLLEVAPEKIHITNRGQEIAIQVLSKDSDYLSAEAEILFYGESVDSKRAKSNIYWLFWNDEDGLRIPNIDATPLDTGPSPQHFLDTHHAEENYWYQPSQPSGDDDRWYWSFMNPKYTTRSFNISLPAVADTLDDATVRGVLKGYLGDPYQRVFIDLNGHRIHTATWPTGDVLNFQIDIPQSYLSEENNNLSVVSAEGIIDHRLLIDWFEIDYHREYRAKEDELVLTADEPGPWEYHIGQLTTSTLDIIDITFPRNPIRMSGFSIITGTSDFSAVFRQNTTDTRQYLVSGVANRRVPLTIERDSPSHLTSPANHADYIIITHRDFYTAVQPLFTFYEQQELDVAVVDVQDIYDEFSAGIVDQEAIRSFLAYAYSQWQPPKPSTVLLVGDGNYDPKNYLGYSEPNYIPPYFADADPWMREVPADNRYVCVSGDDQLPDMHLGRLPVKTATELEILVHRITTYGNSPTASGWNSHILFVADEPDKTAGDFPTLSDAIVTGHLSIPYIAHRVYYSITHMSVSEARAAIHDTIDQGTLIANYIGHGSSWGWANLFQRSDIMLLENSEMLPLFVSMTCLDGYYVEPSPQAWDNSSFAEVAVRTPDKGAIASWSPTGLGLATGHDYLNRALFDAIFKEDIIELGPATTYAKLYLYANSGGQHLDLLDTYLLFGDPATRLNVLPVDVQIAKEVVGHAEPYETGETLTYRLTYTNTGPATAHHVTISDTLPGVLRNLAVVSSGTPVTPQVGSAFVWDVADLPAGAGGVITVTGEIGPYSGALVNTAAIATTSRETETLSNRVTVTTTVIAPDLVITKSVSAPEPLRPGDEIAYTLTFQNIGDATVRDVVIEDRLSAAHEYVSYTATGAPLVVRPGTQYIWGAGDLAPGAGGTITIRATIDTAVTGLITNTATITTSSVESDALNNTGQTTIYVLAPDLVISKRVAPSAFLHPKDPITYTLVFTNAGSELAHQVVISDSVPPQVLESTVVSSSVPITQRTGSAYVWDTVDLAPGASGTITLTGILDSQYEGVVTNRAEISTGTPEYHLTNNAGEATAKVALLFTDLSISQRLTPDSVLRSLQPVTYTILFTNTGPGIARRVVITDALPAALQSPTATSSGAPIALRPGSHYVWDVADLGPTTGGIITITGILSPTMTGYPLTHTVTIGTASVETTTLNNTDVLTVHVAPHRLYLPIVPHGHVPSQAIARWADRDR